MNKPQNRKWFCSASKVSLKDACVTVYPPEESSATLYKNRSQSEWKATEVGWGGPEAHEHGVPPLRKQLFNPHFSSFDMRRSWLTLLSITQYTLAAHRTRPTGQSQSLQSHLPWTGFWVTLNALMCIFYCDVSRVRDWESHLMSCKHARVCMSTSIPPGTGAKTRRGSSPLYKTARVCMLSVTPASLRHWP